jgi:transposase-like protein
MQSRRKFTKDFKLTAIRRLEGGQSAGEVARALEINPADLQRWRRELNQHGERAFSGAGHKRVEESRVAELERKVGRQAMEIGFFKASLAACRGTAPAAGTDQRRAIYQQIDKEATMKTKLTVSRMCRLAEVSSIRSHRQCICRTSKPGCWVGAATANGLRSQRQGR